MPIVKKRAAAQRDLIEHFAYLVEKASVEVADRYLVSAEATFHALARQPLMGAPLALSHPSLTGARKWRVKNFDNYLIFYLPLRNGVSIVRVLHSAKDWRTLLGLES